MTDACIKLDLLGSTETALGNRCSDMNMPYLERHLTGNKLATSCLLSIYLSIIRVDEVAFKKAQLEGSAGATCEGKWYENRSWKYEIKDDKRKSPPVPWSSNCPRKKIKEAERGWGRVLYFRSANILARKSNPSTVLFPCLPRGWSLCGERGGGTNRLLGERGGGTNRLLGNEWVRFILPYAPILSH